MTNLCMKCLTSTKTDSGSIYGQFLLDSLNPGQGITIGNLLRRVLLGDLRGIAITAVRIAGTTHEFSTIEGVREDILEIILNLKGLVIKSSDKYDGNLKFGRLKIQGPSIITANSIELPLGLEVVNPNHYIATISNSNILEMEFKVEFGQGYKLLNKTEIEKAMDFLQIDAIFMPVQKVDFKIENLYDINNENKERLFLEVWTNGSLTPKQAIYKSSELIIQIFKGLLENKIQITNDKPILEIPTISSETHTNISIEELQLSVRAYNCLKRAQINSVSDLLKYSPQKLQEIKNFGQKSAEEVYIALKNKLGITLT